jgi:hypothetical protein
MAHRLTNPAKSPSQEQVRDAYEAVDEQLGQAYWAASTVETKDRIYGIEEIVYDVLMQLYREQLESGTAAYTHVQRQVETVNEKLDQLKQEIDSIIHAVSVAADVAAAIDKAVSLGAKYFAI